MPHKIAKPDGSKAHVATRRVKLQNKSGLHARPAVLFCDMASKFESQVRVTVASKTADGKSIIDLLTLAATPGSEMAIEAKGADSQEAVDALAELIQQNFRES
jgi:phosphotransferase system HPr (HPr) family protein